MSLTREQWCEMWEEIKVIESRNEQMKHELRLVFNLEIGNHVTERAIARIKEKIQSVIGQME